MVIKCDNLIYTPVNALTFRISGDTKCLTPIMEDGKIIALQGGPEDLNINLGLTVVVKKTKYKVNIIEKVGNYKLAYDISMAKEQRQLHLLCLCCLVTRSYIFGISYL